MNIVNIFSFSIYNSVPSLFFTDLKRVLYFTFTEYYEQLNPPKSPPTAPTTTTTTTTIQTPFAITQGNISEDSSPSYILWFSIAVAVLFISLCIALFLLLRRHWKKPQRGSPEKTEESREDSAESRPLQSTPSSENQDSEERTSEDIEQSRFAPMFSCCGRSDSIEINMPLSELLDRKDIGTSPIQSPASNPQQSRIIRQQNDIPTATQTHDSQTGTSNRAQPNHYSENPGMTEAEVVDSGYTTMTGRPLARPSDAESSTAALVDDSLPDQADNQQQPSLNLPLNLNENPLENNPHYYEPADAEEGLPGQAQPGYVPPHDSGQGSYTLASFSMSVGPSPSDAAEQREREYDDISIDLAAMDGEEVAPPHSPHPGDEGPITLSLDEMEEDRPITTCGTTLERLAAHFSKRNNASNAASSRPAEGAGSTATSTTAAGRRDNSSRITPPPQATAAANSGRETSQQRGVTFRDAPPESIPESAETSLREISTGDFVSRERSYRDLLNRDAKQRLQPNANRDPSQDSLPAPPHIPSISQISLDHSLHRGSGDRAIDSFQHLAQPQQEFFQVASLTRPRSGNPPPQSSPSSDEETNLKTAFPKSSSPHESATLGHLRSLPTSPSHPQAIPRSTATYPESNTGAHGHRYPEQAMPGTDITATPYHHSMYINYLSS